MTRLLKTTGPALAAFAALAFLAGPAHAQYRSYYYSSSPLTNAPTFNGFAASAPTPEVIYGSGMASPVRYGTPRSVFYSPGYATTYYRYANETYVPPGFADETLYDAVTFSDRPTTTYVPGYYTPFYRPAYGAPPTRRPPNITYVPTYYP
jgi:hypothetical protein